MDVRIFPLIYGFLSGLFSFEGNYIYIITSLLIAGMHATHASTQKVSIWET